MTETKFGATESVGEGRVTVQFATFNEVDYHGDITLPGAFTEGQEVLVSSYNHASWKEAWPVGRGRIRTDSRAAYADLQFFLDTLAGSEAFKTVRATGNLQQWSYGFNIDKHRIVRDEDGDEVRILERVNVYEVSPVLQGAGRSTRTVAVKDSPSAAPEVPADLAAIRESLFSAEVSNAEALAVAHSQYLLDSTSTLLSGSHLGDAT
ncbi:HK97 family phage prohead protease [Actinomadura sediminis]|uniref:HK97 family phage prohead protease n=1 Tax=Actinomadura sediminis TaxID=1038904 RepID=A0ABW3ES57_9ACTN